MTTDPLEADVEATLANLEARQARLDAAVLEAERKAAEAAIDAAAGRTQDERRAGRKGEDELARVVAEARGKSLTNSLATESLRQEMARRDRDLAEAMAARSKRQNGERLRTLAADLHKAASELDATADVLAGQRMAYAKLADEFVMEVLGGYQTPDGGRARWVSEEAGRHMAVDIIDASRLYPHRIRVTEHVRSVGDEHAEIPSAAGVLARVQCIAEALAIDLQEGR